MSLLAWSGIREQRQRVPMGRGRESDSTGFGERAGPILLYRIRPGGGGRSATAAGNAAGSRAAFGRATRHRLVGCLHSSEGEEQQQELARSKPEAISAPCPDPGDRAGLGLWIGGHGEGSCSGCRVGHVRHRIFELARYSACRGSRTPEIHDSRSTPLVRLQGSDSRPEFADDREAPWSSPDRNDRWLRPSGKRIRA